MVEAPSERTLTRAMSRHDGLGIVDTPPGDERLLQAATTAADAVVIPTRAEGVEFSRVLVTLEMIPPGRPAASSSAPLGWVRTISKRRSPGGTQKRFRSGA